MDTSLKVFRLKKKRGYQGYPSEEGLRSLAYVGESKTKALMYFMSLEETAWFYFGPQTICAIYYEEDWFHKETENAFAEIEFKKILDCDDRFSNTTDPHFSTFGLGSVMRKKFLELSEKKQELVAEYMDWLIDGMELESWESDDKKYYEIEETTLDYIGGLENLTKPYTEKIHNLENKMKLNALKAARPNIPSEIVDMCIGKYL